MEGRDGSFFCLPPPSPSVPSLDRQIRSASGQHWVGCRGFRNVAERPIIGYDPRNTKLSGTLKDIFYVNLFFSLFLNNILESSECRAVLPRSQSAGRVSPCGCRSSAVINSLTLCVKNSGTAFSFSNPPLHVLSPPLLSPRLCLPVSPFVSHLCRHHPSSLASSFFFSLSPCHFLNVSLYFSHHPSLLLIPSCPPRFNPSKPSATFTEAYLILRLNLGWVCVYDWVCMCVCVPTCIFLAHGQAHKLQEQADFLISGPIESVHWMILSWWRADVMGMCSLCVWLRRVEEHRVAALFSLTWQKMIVSSPVLSFSLLQFKRLIILEMGDVAFFFFFFKSICLHCWTAIQSVMSSGNALSPGKTGGVGSAIFNLHDNGTLDYQVWMLYEAHLVGAWDKNTLSST